MIMAQEQAFLKARQQLQAMVAFVEQAADDGQRIDLAERELFSQLLTLGHTLLSAFVAAQGEGDAGPELQAAEGHTVRRSKSKHARRYLSIFGELRIARFVIRTAQRPKDRAGAVGRTAGPAGWRVLLRARRLARATVCQRVVS